MKRIILLFLLLALAVSLCACGDKPEPTPMPPSEPVELSSEPAESSPAPDASQPALSQPEVSQPQNKTSFPEGVSYTEEYKLEGDPGDGLSAAAAAIALYYTESAYFGNTGEAITIKLYGLDFVEGSECYLYSVEDENGAVSRYAVDYSTGAAYVLLEESGKYLLMEENGAGAGGSDPGDTNNLNWWGEYVGDGYSILINNFDGDSFRFAVSDLQNGTSVFEGVAAIDPDDDHLAVYENVGFYLYEKEGTIDFLTAEGAEWEHLRGQYTQD